MRGQESSGLEGLKPAEITDSLRQSLRHIEDMAAHNSVPLTEFRVVIESAFDLHVSPNQPVLRFTRRIERSDPRPIGEWINDPFQLVLAGAVPEDRGDQLGLKMIGNSPISDDGIFYTYEFDPLAGHDLQAVRSRESEKFVEYRSGVAYVGADKNSRHTFIIY